MGSNILLENFEGSIVTLKGAGTTYPVHIMTYCEMLHRLLNEDNWKQALRICRRANVSIHSVVFIYKKGKNLNELSNFILFCLLFRSPYYGQH